MQDSTLNNVITGFVKGSVQMHVCASHVCTRNMCNVCLHVSVSKYVYVCMCMYESMHDWRGRSMACLLAETVLLPNSSN